VKVASTDSHWAAATFEKTVMHPPTMLALIAGFSYPAGNAVFSLGCTSERAAQTTALGCQGSGGDHAPWYKALVRHTGCIPVQHCRGPSLHKIRLRSVPIGDRAGKGRQGVLPAGDKKHAIAESLVQAERQMQLAEAQVAKGLGYTM
jgi:hypothetical protein